MPTGVDLITVAIGRRKDVLPTSLLRHHVANERILRVIMQYATLYAETLLHILHVRINK